MGLFKWLKDFFKLPARRVKLENVLNLPLVLRSGDLTLPTWAKIKSVNSGGVSLLIEVDTDGYVKEWLPLLGIAPQSADQYWLEVAYQCAKMDLQMAITDTKFDPRIAGKFAEFRFNDCPQWALSRFQPGRGIEAATKGKEAREHYKRVRGKLPF
jgi:hypothetical protein